MAEGLLKHFHGKRIYVDSAGVRSLAVNPFAVSVTQELGIDISRHRSKIFEALADTSFDIVITFSPEAHHAALELTRTMACDVEYWPIMDPSILEGSREAVLDAFRGTRDQIKAKLLGRFPLSGLAAI